MLRQTMILVALTTPLLAGWVQAEPGSGPDPHPVPDRDAPHTDRDRTELNWLYRDVTLNVVSSSYPGPGGTLIHTADWPDNQNCLYIHGLRHATITQLNVEARPERGDVPGDWLLRASIAGRLDDYTARGPLPVQLATGVADDIGGFDTALEDRILIETIPVGDGPASADGAKIALSMAIKAGRPDWVTFEFPDTCTG